MLPHPHEAYLQFEGYFMIHRLPHTEGRPRKARAPPLTSNTGSHTHQLSRLTTSTAPVPEETGAVTACVAVTARSTMSPALSETSVLFVKVDSSSASSVCTLDAPVTSVLLTRGETVMVSAVSGVRVIE